MNPTLKMAAMASFHAEKCYHMVSVHSVCPTYAATSASS